jgi:thiol-disulfide isomerase/thioredoxin
MSPGRRDALILGTVALGAAAVGGVAGALFLQSNSGAAALLARRFPDISGTPRRLIDWQGKALLCNFWATWCAPCREEMPMLDAAHRRYSQKGLQIVGIAIDSAENVAKFVGIVSVGYPLLLGDASAIDLMRELGNSSGGLPFTVLLDRHGRLVERKLGVLSAADLETRIQRLLQ